MIKIKNNTYPIIEELTRLPSGKRVVVVKYTNTNRKHRLIVGEDNIKKIERLQKINEILDE